MKGKVDDNLKQEKWTILKRNTAIHIFVNYNLVGRGCIWYQSMVATRCNLGGLVE
jgi:hypothetical protein